MLPRLRRLSTIAVYVPDLQRALAMYQALGLEPRAPHPGAATGTPEVTLRFPDGGAELTLHSDPQRQFVELWAGVDDVREVYQQLARCPDYTWLETPQPDGDGWRAVVRLPDDNVFTLHAAHGVPVGAEGA